MKRPFQFAVIPNKKYKYFVFLDIDGVLESESFSKIVCDGTASPHESKFNISQELVNILNNFSHFEDDIAIIITSTRRFDYSIKGWSTILKGVFGLTIPIIGITPKCESRVRGAEIKMWLNKYCDKFTGVNHYSFRDYVIIDDDNDMLIEQIPNFIQTNGYMGLHYNDVHKGCAYLANDPFYFNKS